MRVRSKSNFRLPIPTQKFEQRVHIGQHDFGADFFKPMGAAEKSHAGRLGIGRTQAQTMKRIGPAIVSDLGHDSAARGRPERFD